MQALFPDSFLADIGRLTMAVRAAPVRAAVGTHLSRASGASLTFRDYQAYTPGDDLRRVDWAVYGRTRHLFVRRFERPTGVPVFVLVDNSVSMRVETPDRYATAARVAAAVAAAALNGQNPVRAHCSGGPSTTTRAVTGRRGFLRVLTDLADAPAAGSPGLATTLRAVLPSFGGSGVLVVVSDFFDEAGIEAILDPLRSSPHRLVLARVVQPWDAEPDLQGDWELADCESDARLTVSADAAALERYRRAYRDYFGRLEHFATGRGATHALFDASRDTLAQPERLFPGGTLSV